MMTTITIDIGIILTISTIIFSMGSFYMLIKNNMQKTDEIITAIKGIHEDIMGTKLQLNKLDLKVQNIENNLENNYVKRFAI